MKKIEIEEMKKIEIKILEYVTKFCDSNNITYFLYGGSVLGAIRHKGFIPWDDDIDIAMPRKDYNNFVNLYCKANNKKYILENINTDDKYGYLFSKVYDTNTYLKESFVNRKNNKLGVHIDIFPLDNIGKTYKEAKIVFMRKRFLKAILVSANWSKYKLSKTHPLRYEPIRLFFYIISRFFDPNKLAKKLEKEFNTYSKYSSNYMASTSGLYPYIEIFEGKVYQETTTVEFEGKTYKTMKNYDVFLKQLYGDYMKLPPVEKRKTHHTYIPYKL